MNILASDAAVAPAEHEHTLRIANDADLAALAAEGVKADAAQRQFERYNAFYQGDVLEPRPHFVREPARPQAQPLVAAVEH